MTYENAKLLVSAQDKNLKKVNNVKFTVDNYEYKIVYEGGWTCFTSIYRRPVGKRNYKFFGAVGGWKCDSASSLLDLCYKEINLKDALIKNYN